MIVEPSQWTSAIWTKWQGHVINDLLLLGRYLGGSDHSGVFLADSAAHRSPQVAVKLIPATPSAAQTRLALWKKVSALTHPHLLGLLEGGSCQLDGSPHLYVVMEYAEQTLAQLLQHRALTDEEAREMLLPILDTLAVLHSQKLVQGQLKPTNILVAGDQLKLASDTIHRVGDSTGGRSPRSLYDPPEAQPGSASTAGDIWALGVSLCEALAQRPPQGLDGSRITAVLPPELSPAFGAIIASCLSTSARNRPSVAELMAWLAGKTVASAPATIHTPAAPFSEARIAERAPPTTPRPRPAPKAEPDLPVTAQPLKPPVLLAAAVGALVALVLGWTAVHALIAHRAAVQGVTAPAEVARQVPAPPVSVPEPTAPPAAIHEVIPDVPKSVLDSIHTHIVIGVRVIVEQDGSVFAALEDQTNASKRLRRLALEAAKEWTFPPSDTPSRRVMQIRFDFHSDGTTASARALD